MQVPRKVFKEKKYQKNKFIMFNFTIKIQKKILKFN